jgi:hypothetical protein
MIDVFLVIVPIVLLFCGKRHVFIRRLIASNLILSSLFSLIVPIYFSIESLDPGIFYYNFLLPVFLCYLSCRRPDRYTVEASIPFVLTGILSFSVYIEYFTASNGFYSIYSGAMLFLSGWQLYLLVKIGNVIKNVRRWVFEFLANIFWRNFHLSHVAFDYKYTKDKEEA